MIDVYFFHLSTNEGPAERLRARARVLAFVPMEKHDARPALDRARAAREESSSACVFMRTATLFRVVGDRGRRAASTSVGRRGASVSRASESSARGRRRGCASSANSRRGRVSIPCARPSGTSEREVKSAPEVDDGEADVWYVLGVCHLRQSDGAGDEEATEESLACAAECVERGEQLCSASDSAMMDDDMDEDAAPVKAGAGAGIPMPSPSAREESQRRRTAFAELRAEIERREKHKCQ